jgi:sugar O-acyltransferase (sialic acid O-acetyltransferase NeuD family)
VKDVIIFGVQDNAQLAHYYLTNDSDFKIVGFSVDSDYIPDNGTFCNLPVFDFQKITITHPPSDFVFFAPLAPNRMNKDREKIYLTIKKLGYDFISYISSKATVLTTDIGENCFILEDNTIQPFTKIGNNVLLWSGNHIGHHGIIHDHVTFTSHVVMSGHCTINSFSFFGVNSSIRNGLTIAEGTFIAMASCVTSNTEKWSVYKGHPAKKQNYSSSNIIF